MTFRYAEAFGRSRSTGYETLLLEVVRGDQTLFVHADEAEASWRLYTPLLRKRRRCIRYPGGRPGTGRAPLIEPDPGPSVSAGTRCRTAPRSRRPRCSAFWRRPIPRFVRAGNFASCLPAETRRVRRTSSCGDARADWGAWHIYFGDERCVPRDDPARNSRMAEEAWLDHVAIPALQRHPIPGELGAAAAAQAYCAILQPDAAFDLGAARPGRGRSCREPVSRARLGRGARIASRACGRSMRRRLRASACR